MKNMKKIKARKNWKCDKCNCVIKKGEENYCEEGKFLQTLKKPLRRICKDCFR